MIEYSKTKKVFIIAFILLMAVGLFFRLYHIEFGLPHSFHADEPEIAEFAIKYTYEIRGIVQTGEYYKLIPLNFVYGTVPTYFFTLATMFFSKASNLFGAEFDKTTLYIFMRSLNAITSILIIPASVLIYLKLFGEKKKALAGALLTTFFVALNWKLIVHAHYINVDIVVALLLTLSYLTAIVYFQRENDTKYTILTGIFFGLAVGTKFTVLITLPLYIYLFVAKKDIRNMFAFLFVMFGAFVFSNPFSLAFAKDFVFRMYMLSVKENGLVFDSVDFGVFKYVHAANFLVTPLVVLLFVFGGYLAVKYKEKLPLHIFLLITVVVYLIFFSLSSRRVDRWLLPILPIILIYASYGLASVEEFVKPLAYYVLLIVVLFGYVVFPSLLLHQFQRNTPKSAAYLWMRDYVPISSNKLVITKEGLDPMNKLQGVHVLNYEVYESDNAQYRLPENPIGYDYVVLSSRPMEIYKKGVLTEKYRFYTDAWREFEENVLDESKFTLVKSFVNVKPNLVELSDVYIYKSINPNPSNQEL